MNKNDAYQFLKQLTAFLNEQTPAAPDMAKAVKAIIAASKVNNQSHKGFPEGAFLNEFITPNINRFLIEKIGFSPIEARDSLLSESYRRIPEIAFGSPTRSIDHPFKKVLGARPSEIMRSWEDGSGTTKSAPDIALRKPISVVIEGKYFQSGGIQSAKTTLVNDIYQTFFYLGLPNIPDSKTHPEWNYDYGCLIAYDGSEEKNLKVAWESLPSKVKDAFWEGANIYVMILEGNKQIPALQTGKKPFHESPVAV